MRCLLTSVLTLCVVSLAGCDGTMGEVGAGGGGTAGGTPGGMGGAAGGTAGGNGSAGGSGGGSAGGSGGGSAGGAGGGSAGTGGGSAVGGGSGRVPVFIAVGKMGRRTISCDDGRSWKNDVSEDDKLVPAERFECFSGDHALLDGGTIGTDCDHNQWSTTSFNQGNGTFVETLGWGAPGRIRRSTDGVTWQDVFSGSTFSGMMFGNGHFIAASRNPRVSINSGQSWDAGTVIELSNGSNTIYNVRSGGFGGTGNGAFVVTAQDGQNSDFAYSHNNGATWQRPTMAGGGRVDPCEVGEVISGNGVLLTLSSSGIACRSTDNGATWRSVALNAAIESRMVWTGTEFMAWGNSNGNKLFRSANGASWTATPISSRRNQVMGAGPIIGPVAISPGGTFVAVRGGWRTWYAGQEFYRSTDGIVWDVLPDTAYKKGHPMGFILFAYAERSAVCP